MADINLHFDLTFSGRSIRWATACLLIFACAPELGSESVTLTTYYPAPSGIYAQMITTGNTYLARDSGAVGVRTTSPQANMALDVNGFSHSIRQEFGTAAAAYVSTSAVDSTGLGFYANGTEYLSISNAGAIYAGYNATSGSGPSMNVYLGYDAGATTHASNVYVGYNQTTSALAIGNTGVSNTGQTNTGIALDVNGVIRTDVYSAAANGCTEQEVNLSGTTSTNCSAANYATLIPGIYSKYQAMPIIQQPTANVTGNIVDSNKEAMFFCCPCASFPGGVCPN